LRLTVPSLAFVFGTGLSGGSDRRFQFHKRSQFFIRTHNKTLSVAAFEMGISRDAADREAAKKLQWATDEVWKKMESALGGEDDKHDNYYYGLDNQTKKKLDKEIDPIVRDVIIEPFNSYPNEAQPTAISRESPIPFP
jgi:hypothetical protein